MLFHSSDGTLACGYGYRISSLANVCGGTERQEKEDEVSIMADSASAISAEGQVTLRRFR